MNKYAILPADECTENNPELEKATSADELLRALRQAFNRMTGSIEQLREVLGHMRDLRHIIAASN